MKRPLALFPLLLLHILLGINALYGGWMLMNDPLAFGMKAEWVDDTPFRGYFLPGLILFVLLGVFPLFTCIGLLGKPGWQWAGWLNIYPDRHWAWTYSLFTSLMVLIWMNVQMFVIPSFWLQPFFLAGGLLILILTLWPAIMRYYLISKT